MPILPESALERLQAGNLFYPCSGRDVGIPVSTFLSRLTDFWFVDTRYDHSPLLAGHRRYRLLDRQCESITGKTLRRGEPYELKVWHEIYEDIRCGREFRVHKCCGRGYDAFRGLIKQQRKQLSVFFYRGDSPGEGGSGFWWLQDARLRNVLEYLEDGGLIITDGSNAKNSTHQLSAFSGLRDSPGRRAMEMALPFTFRSWDFECVGYLGERYGPTLAWQVTRRKHEKPS